MKLLVLALLPLLALALGRTQKTPGAEATPGSVLGKVDGKDVYSFTLQNRGGLSVTLTNFGATVMSIKLADGKPDPDIVLGYSSLAGYQTKEDPYFGAIVGRYGNRIAKGRFKLEGKEYTLATNNGPNSLHGGNKGFDKRVWDVLDSGPDHVTLHYLSPDGEEGYPGNLNVTVKYTLTDKDELKIEYTATTDKPTVLNITNHTYFNLAGEGNGDILNQIPYIDADRFTPVDSTLIPTGELKSVVGTPFDFKKPSPIGAHINDKDQQLEYGRGYDHNYVLNHPGKLRFVARVADPVSKRMVIVSTDQPGLQFYTGNFLDGTIKGKSGKIYNFRGAFCLETQHFPDSPNHPSFPSTELKPGQTFHSTTIFQFTTGK